MPDFVMKDGVLIAYSGMDEDVYVPNEYLRTVYYCDIIISFSHYVKRSYFKRGEEE